MFSPTSYSFPFNTISVGRWMDQVEPPCQRPSGYVKIAIENGHIVDLPIKMVIVHSFL